MSPFVPKNYLQKQHIVMKSSLPVRKKSQTQVNKLVAQQIWQLMFDQAKQLRVITRRKDNIALKF
jgi:hypothetical protein